MKAFKVSAVVKGKEVTIILEAASSWDARQKARTELGYETRGNFFPLHWSEITGCVKY